MSRRLKIGILGCANIAERYSIKAFQSIPNAEVVSIASRDINKAKEWADKFGIPNFESYDSLVDNPKVDAVYIPLPIGLHKEWIIRCAKKGKHVLSEKSLAPNLEDVKQIVESCKKNGVVLYENFTCDYHPQHQAVVNAINSDNIGKPYLFQSTYGFPIISGDNFRYKKDLGGSALSESGAYQVYTARKLFGREPLSVSAYLYHDAEKGIDMNGSVNLDFGDNILAQFSFNQNAVYQNHYSVWGQKGLIRVGRAYAIPPDMKPKVEIVRNENRQEVIMPLDLPASNHFENIFTEFCGLVLDKENQKEKIDKKYEDILVQAKVLEAIRVSSQSGKVVKLVEL